MFSHGEAAILASQRFGQRATVAPHTLQHDWKAHITKQAAYLGHIGIEAIHLAGDKTHGE